MKRKRRMVFLVWLLIGLGLLNTGTVLAKAEGTELIQAPHGVLMEASTGTIIYEKDMDTRVKPASITKIMTLILIFDEIEKGSLHMEDEVITSAYAKSMGGSQVFLEEGEKQSVETMIKCIVIASGNDASVAMAEHIAGSEGAFVEKMNERAKGLGMENTIKGTIKSSILFTDTLESKIDYLVNKLKIKKFSLHIHPYVAAYLNQGLMSLKRKWQMKYGFGIKIIPSQKLAFLEYVFYDSHGEEIDMKEEFEIK